jgi:hypothetical protein
MQHLGLRSFYHIYLVCFTANFTSQDFNLLVKRLISAALMLSHP